MRRPLAFRSLKFADFRRKEGPRAVSDGTTLLFGLPGVRVERVERLADGTRVIDQNGLALARVLIQLAGPDKDHGVIR